MVCGASDFGGIPVHQGKIMAFFRRFSALGLAIAGSPAGVALAIDHAFVIKIVTVFKQSAATPSDAK